MKARNIEITEDNISFEIFNDDNKPYMNEKGRPVVQSIGGWLNLMPTEFTESDVQSFIDDEIYRTVRDIEKNKGIQSAKNAKIKKLPVIQSALPPEIKMTELPVVKITTVAGEYESPVKIEGSIVNAAEMVYTVLDDAGNQVDAGTIETSPFSIMLTLTAGAYSVVVKGGNRRGVVEDSVAITIIAAPKSV